jgi:two-component system, OmpR family, heavy metal sensor histidine kinase CusS
VNRRSIRVRLTAWYLAVLAPSTLALAVGSTWLFRHSVIDAADGSLSARIEAVRHFINSAERALTEEELKVELTEYVQLTSGAALLEVAALSGLVVCKPALAGWDNVDRDHALTSSERTAHASRTFQGESYRAAGATIQGPHDRYRALVAVPMDRSFDALNRFQRWLAWLVPAVLLVAAVGGYWIAGRALAPVDRITRAAQAITVRNLDRRLDVPGADDELRRLALTFNDMLGRLQAAVADIVRLTAEASHELRTPVALVRATAEVTLSRERTTGEYRQALADILEESTRMSSLVDDLLTLARADAGVEPVESVQVDLSHVLTEAERAVQATAPQLSFSVDLQPARVKGSPESLRRLFVILLENATKYSHPGGAVTVRLRTTAAGPGANASAVAEVTDTGIGLDPVDRPHLFDRFYRGAAARHHAAAGSGLGLSIARTIVIRYRGTIEIVDGPNGRGCTARVTLPSMSPT